MSQNKDKGRGSEDLCVPLVCDASELQNRKSSTSLPFLIEETSFPKRTPVDPGRGPGDTTQGALTFSPWALVPFLSLSPLSPSHHHYPPTTTTTKTAGFRETAEPLLSITGSCCPPTSTKVLGDAGLSATPHHFSRCPSPVQV